MKKVALISDVHGNLQALESVLKDLGAMNIPRTDTYCLGDVIGYGPFPNEVVALIEAEAIPMILGNHDEARLQMLGDLPSDVDRPMDWTADQLNDQSRAFLKALPTEMVLDLDGVSLLLTHGSPNHIAEYIYEEDRDLMAQLAQETTYDYIATGHTHLTLDTQSGKTGFINPGSVGRPKGGDWRASYCIVTVTADKTLEVTFRKVAYDVDAVVAAIEKTDLPASNGAFLVKDRK